MNNLVAVLIVGLMTLGIIFLTVVLGTLTGAVAGWIVGLFFGDIILNIFGQIGIHGVTMWQIGAFLGFFGGFFRATIKIEKKD